MSKADRAAGYDWTRVTGRAPWAPRDGAGLLAFRGRMWLLGGWNPDDREHFPLTCNSEVWSSADGVTWQLHGLAPWEGRHTAGWAVHQGAMWVVGGDCNQGHYQNDVWRSTDGEHWDCVCRQVPWAPRALHQTVVHDGAIWVLGGQTMPAFAGGEERFYDDVWRSRDGATWECVCPSAPWPARGAIGGAAVHGGRMWLLGGGRYDTPATPERAFWNDVWASADGADWECVTGAAPWHPRMYHEVAAWDGQLWVLEGWHTLGGNRHDVWRSADGAVWEEVPGTPWTPRHAASVTVFDGALWVAGGNNMESDVWRLWRRGPVGPYP